MQPKALKKYVLLFLACAPCLIMTAAWLMHRWSRITDSWPYFWGALGNLCALVGLPLLLAMFFLGSRFPAVERCFGLDRMIRLHKLLGTAVVALFSSHAGLRFVKVWLKGTGDVPWEFLFALETGGSDEWGMNLARIALGGLVVTGGLARAGTWFLPFRLWKVPHLLLYVIVPAGLVHARLVGDDIERYPYNLIWWAAVIAWGLVAGYRISYFAKRGRECIHSADSIVPEARDTGRLCLSPVRKNSSFDGRAPGQFALLRVKRRFGWSEPHPFTIACPPQQDRLCFIIKRTGAFTAGLAGLEPQTPVLCEGPYGLFTPDFEAEKTITMIAGGVGVTPFLSIIRHVAVAGLDNRLVLIWSNKTREDIIAGAELEQLASRGRLRIVHVLTRQRAAAPDLPGGQTTYVSGHIHAGLLSKHIPPDTASLYLCGPPAMQRSVLSELRKAFGIDKYLVKQEFFSF